MLGAIAGDIIGSVYEGRKQWMLERNPNFQPLFARNSRFTDDTVLTIAVADFLLNQRDLTETLKAYANTYPNAGYGRAFRNWAFGDDNEPYHSFGNGSAMRVSPVAYAFQTLDDVLLYAKETASVTHNHPDGIRGAQAIAASIFLARRGESKESLSDYVSGRFRYNLSIPIEQIRWTYSFDSSCSGTVPQAITAALESTDYESAVRLAVSLGGDCDTLASMAGAVAEAMYGGLPPSIAIEARSKLDDHLLDILDRFTDTYVNRCG